MRKQLLIAVLGLSLATFACEDPAANKAKATVAEPSGNVVSNSAVNSSGSPSVKGEAVALDSENSKVEFTGSKVTGSHNGGFRNVSGSIDLVGKKPEDSGVFVDIDTTSVYTDDEKLTKHLTSKDFFEVEKFPKSTFRSTKIEPAPSEGVDVYTVTGDFDLHG
ncbi:MAG TPA: YceI family protein, partial [Pyrinomonadaceae bacterium]